MDKNIKVLAPLRVSTDRQDLESQKMDMKNFITSLGYEEDQIIYLEAKGASAFKQDQDYLDFIEEIKRLIIENPNIKRVAVWHLNRLGRNETPLTNIKNFLIEHKIQFTIKEPEMDLLNPDGSVNAGIELCFSLFATMSKQQIQELKAKTSRAKKYLLSKGRYIGGKIKFGYTIDENKYFIVDDVNSKIVQLIFELYANKRFSTYTLVDELKLRGYSNLDGNLLNQDAINSILKDNSYIGERFYPRIISDEIWNKAAEKLKTNNKYIDKTKKLLLGAKLVKCPVCGSALVRATRRYSCWRKEDESKVGSVSIDCNQLDQVLIFESKFYHISYLNNLNSMEKKDINDEISVLKEKIKNVETLISGLTKKKIKIQEAYEEEIYTKEQREEKLRKVLDSEKAYKKNIIDINEEIEKKKKVLEEISKANKVDKYIDILSSVYNESDKKVLYEIIHRHIKRVELKKKSAYNFEVKLIMSDDKEIVYDYFPKSKTYKWYKKNGSELVGMFYVSKKEKEKLENIETITIK